MTRVSAKQVPASKLCTMLREGTPADLPAIRELFARANDAPYDLAAVAEEKCFAPGFHGETAVRIAGDADAVSVTCGRALRILIVDRAQRGRGLGSALLKDAEQRGVRVIAAEAGNYFLPGTPENDPGSRAFFAHRGYNESRWTWNLHAALHAPLESSAHDATDDTRSRVLDFIGTHFGRIWRFEANRGEIVYTSEGNRISGFAAYDANNHGLGFFGPTGVDPALRGRGLGRQLLLAALERLRRQGHRRAVIPWTDALEFYRRSCGAEPAHRFVTFSKASDR